MIKLKLFAILIILVIFISSDTIFLFGESAISENSNLNELLEIENAIIIKGIESSHSNLPNGNEINNLEGTIIYDDSFNVNSHNKYKKEIPNNENVIKKLKRQDKRWHVTTHRIKKGENLWSLAKKFDTDYKIIIKINEINDPNRLNPGNTILIPNRIGINHKVSINETLIKIAKKYRVKKESIVFSNKIKKNIIKEGDLIFIPDAVEPAEKIVKYSKTKSEIFNDSNKDIEEEGSLINQEMRGKPNARFNWPLKGDITSAFGKRKNPMDNRSRFHCGLDISASIGTPVKASAAGEAIYSGWKKGYGRVVILKHSDGYITVYAHNKKNIIQTGEKTEAGDLIAFSGISGAVTGPHLHYEIRKYLTPLNPLRFLE